MIKRSNEPHRPRWQVNYHFTLCIDVPISGCISRARFAVLKREAASIRFWVVNGAQDSHHWPLGWSVSVSLVEVIGN